MKYFDKKNNLSENRVLEINTPLPMLEKQNDLMKKFSKCLKAEYQ